MTKAIFSEKQETVQTFTVDGNTTVIICLNEEEVAEPQTEGEASCTEYSYDFNSFTDVSGNIDLDAVKADPAAYLTYQPASAPTAEERLSELEQAFQDLALSTLGGDK